MSDEANERVVNGWVSDVFGLRPGERLAEPVAAARPGWARPLAQLAWGWLDGIARAQDGRVHRHRVVCVPVWHALAEDDIDVPWRRGFVALSDHGLQAFVQEPSVPLDGLVTLEADVTVASRVVAGASPEWGIPVVRQLGPYAVLRKRVALSLVRPVEVDHAPWTQPAAPQMEPWTQQVVLGVDPSCLSEPLRLAAEDGIGELSDAPA